MIASKRFLVCLTLLSALGAPAARADSPLSVIFGYGGLYQTRQDVDVAAHVVAIGAAGRLSDEMYSIFDIQFGIDQEYSDFCHLSLSFMTGYAVGPEAFTFWIGGGARYALDGYPDPSGALDIGLGAGFLSMFGGAVGLGADFRGWLGLNWYSDRQSDDISFLIEPYFEWRAYVAVGF